jgi:hypothetical protein
MTGALHSEDHKREMIGDWDLRAASELTSYLSRHGYQPKIETPIYQPEFVRKFAVEDSVDYIEQVKKEIKLGEKNCVIIASPDVNPLTEMVLGKLYEVSDSSLFTGEARDLPADAVVICKVRKQNLPEDGRSAEGETPSEATTQNEVRIHRGQSTPAESRVFYSEGKGTAANEQRGLKSLQMGTEPKLLNYLGQDEARAADQNFDVYAHLVVARNPFTPADEPPRYVIVLNGVSGPATFALTHVLTGGGSKEFVSYPDTFDSEAESEMILSKVVPKVVEEKFHGLQFIIRVTVGHAPTGEEGGATEGLCADADLYHPELGATFDWRRILGWRLDTNLLRQADGVKSF